MRGRRNKLWLGVVLACVGATTAHGQSVLDRVHRENTVRCAAAPRTGFAEAGADGRLTGLGLDLCRAMAVAVLGSGARISFELDETEQVFAALQEGRADLAFAEEDELVAHRDGAIEMAGMVLTDSVAVMVTSAAPITTLPDLAGRRVCLMIGSAGQQALEALDAQLALHLVRLAFSEDVEMLDAYNARRCDAAVAEVSQLQAMSEMPGVAHRQSRLLTSALVPIGVQAIVKSGDTRWSTAVRGMVNALTGFTPGEGVPGLPGDWQPVVETSVGTYHTMLERNVVDHCCVKPTDLGSVGK